MTVSPNYCRCEVIFFSKKMSLIQLVFPMLWPEICPGHESPVSSWPSMTCLQFEGNSSTFFNCFKSTLGTEMKIYTCHLHVPLNQHLDSTVQPFLSNQIFWLTMNYAISALHLCDVYQWIVSDLISIIKVIFVEKIVNSGPHLFLSININIISLYERNFSHFLFAMQATKQIEQRLHILVIWKIA